MKLIDAEWTPKINFLIIQCKCGCEFKHRADRWKVQCPSCYKFDNLEPIRERYLNVH